MTNIWDHHVKKNDDLFKGARTLSDAIDDLKKIEVGDEEMEKHDQSDVLLADIPSESILENTKNFLKVNKLNSK